MGSTSSSRFALRLAVLDIFNIWGLPIDSRVENAKCHKICNIWQIAKTCNSQCPPITRIFSSQCPPISRIFVIKSVSPIPGHLSSSQCPSISRIFSSNQCPPITRIFVIKSVSPRYQDICHQVSVPPLPGHLSSSQCPPITRTFVIKSVSPHYQDICHQVSVPPLPGYLSSSLASNDNCMKKKKRFESCSPPMVLC